MKRRDVLKGLTLAAGGAFRPTASWGAAEAETEDKPKSTLAVPIRALARKNGKLVQPIQINLQTKSPNGSVITRMNGEEIDRRPVPSAASSFEVYIDPVQSTQTAAISVEVNGSTQSENVELRQVLQMLIYVLPHSHHDLGYTDLQADVEEKQMQNITRGIELARKTADYPEGSRFVWNLEVLWGADLFMQRRPQSEKAAFLEAVRNGWIGLNGSYANELTGLCRPEELLQLFRYGTRLGKQCGVKIDSAMMSDVPGFSWGTVPAMSQAGIRYFSAAPNYFDRIGTFMVAWQDKPFYWVGPSGKDKILFWVPWTGYAMSHVMKLGADFVSKYQDRMDEVHYPYDISYIRWSGHGDNAEPDPELSEFLRSWNEKYEWPRFHIASTSTAFSAFEARYGNQLPQYRGDLTPYWEDGAGSSALETRMNRNAADRLSEAAALTAMRSAGTYAPASYDAAWRDVLLYSEHTWGAWCSVSDSENPFTKKQWEVKRAFAVDADHASEELLQSALGATSQSSGRIEIHNPTSWDRSEIVYLSKQLSSAGDHVTDNAGKPVPSQRLSTGELAVRVSKVPAFGVATYNVSSQKAHDEGSPVSFNDGVLGNGIIQAKIDPSTGNITALHRHGDPQNLVDTSQGGSVNEYLFLAGKDINHLQRSGPAKITVEEQGPLLITVKIKSPAPGCNSLMRRLRLAAGADYLELSNLVDKQRAPLNPHPGVGGPGDDFAQRGSKESVQFAFPFAIPNGRMSMDIALGNMEPEIDQLPGSCKNWIPVGRWIDISNDNTGLTWATLDAPLVEVGYISATMLGSQKTPDVWRKHIEKTQTFYSWVMNNHWGTNYLAYQEGPVEFRYALRPHGPVDAAAASRFAVGLSEPLEITDASHEKALSHSLLRVEPEDVLAFTLKPSDDGKAWIVRLFGASGKSREAHLNWAPRMAGKAWYSNLAEEQLEPAPANIPVAGWELITLRVDRV
ncbi:glycoside hydrolase family 38 N-terminal domain-containing protein [Silvibacterium acidisoli]|uniref:glycoside hydrolase family 38 N-terminal domain-containing protein n=1 Tax=Acidobacteriaceae bacterium ZG23-2 TaxID=2883246 RepID=UPI00406C1EBD